LNTALTLLQLTAICFTALFWYPAVVRRGTPPNPWLGGVTAASWFITALATLMDSVAWLPQAFLYVALGVLCVVQTIGGIFEEVARAGEW